MKWEGRRQSSHIEVAAPLSERDKSLLPNDMKDQLVVNTFFVVVGENSIEEMLGFDGPQYVKFNIDGSVDENFFDTKQRLSDMQFVIYTKKKEGVVGGELSDPTNLAIVRWNHRMRVVKPSIHVSIIPVNGKYEDQAYLVNLLFAAT